MIKTTKPPIASASGQIQAVVTSSQLDPFGREAALTDARGNSTRQRFNAYGSITQIDYPDGATERYRYDKKGELILEIDPQGIEVRYVRDVLDRILLKIWHAPSGEELARETFTYQGYQLVEETDREGRVTRYAYDGGGRKVQEKACGRTTRFAYDPLGRLERTEHGDQALVIRYVRDLLGREIESAPQAHKGVQHDDELALCA